MVIILTAPRQRIGMEKKKRKRSRKNDRASLLLQGLYNEGRRRR